MFQLKTFIIYIYKIFYKEKDLFLIKIILLLKYVEIKNDKYILQKKNPIYPFNKFLKIESKKKNSFDKITLRII